jgi:hypothetical protein
LELDLVSSTPQFAESNRLMESHLNGDSFLVAWTSTFIGEFGIELEISR